MRALLSSIEATAAALETYRFNGAFAQAFGRAHLSKPVELNASTRVEG